MTNDGPRLVTFSVASGGSGEALLNGQVELNRLNCAVVGNALVVAPDTWSLDIEDSAQEQESQVDVRLRVGSKVALVGAYRSLEDDQLTAVDDCVDDATSEIFYASSLAKP